MTNLLAILACIAMTESNGDPNAVGVADDIGILQITPIMVQDMAERYPHMRFTPGDRWSPKRSAQMCLCYWHTYCTVRRLGRVPTEEDYVMCLHQGPNWYKQPRDEQHWRRYQWWKTVPVNLRMFEEGGA